jgi:hypothetical protein
MVGEVLTLTWGLVITVKDVALTCVMVGCAHLLSADGKADLMAAASRRRVA